ncbi:MAG TPA: VOC family protein [Propionicimonas sp.]|nr:VOC family protein [Propionicimonas sp.]HRA05563.1 VOC family protein [Propionicimonas sp.]
MSLSFQVTVDCADPHAQADWWAETLGWEVEPSDEAFIRRMIAEGHATQDETLVHRGQLVWATGAAIRVPDAPVGSPCSRVLFQMVPEPRTVKNRVHLDVRLGRGADLDAARDALIARGATFLHEAAQGPFRWYTLADPEANEFCVSE